MNESASVSEPSSAPKPKPELLPCPQPKRETESEPALEPALEPAPESKQEPKPEPNPKSSEEPKKESKLEQEAEPISKQTSKSGSGSASETQPVSTTQRRRPPPLPVVKTSSTKKEKYTLIAKCTEPKPGQTRYWTEEEHERFLEAVAEYGEKAYVAISNYVETRTPKQVRTHAQKFQMKMARLARQSIEAGQPIQMPPGMRPVIELPIGTKSTIVTITPDQTIKLASKSVQGISEIDPSIVSALSASQSESQAQAKKRAAEKVTKEEDKPTDALVKMSSTVSDESSSDPYLDYIGAAGDTKEEMELENTFAAKLTQTLQGAPEQKESTDGDFLMSDGSSDEAVSSRDDDDLEELEKLEDGEFSLAPFANPSESWLMPEDASAAPTAQQ